MQSGFNWGDVAANYAAQQQAMGFPNIGGVGQTIGGNAYTTYGGAGSMQQMNPGQWGGMGAAVGSQPWQTPQEQQQWQQWQQQYQQWHSQYGEKYQEAMKAAGGQGTSFPGMSGYESSFPPPPPPDDKPAPPLPPDDNERPPPPPGESWSGDNSFQRNNKPRGRGRGGNQNRAGLGFQQQNQFHNSNQSQNSGGFSNMSGSGGASNFQNQNTGFQGGKRAQEMDSFRGDDKRQRQDNFGGRGGFGNQDSGDRGRGGRGARGGRGMGRGGNRGGRGGNQSDQGYSTYDQGQGYGGGQGFQRENQGFNQGMGSQSFRGSSLGGDQSFQQQSGGRDNFQGNRNQDGNFRNQQGGFGGGPDMRGGDRGNEGGMKQGPGGMKEPIPPLIKETSKPQESLHELSAAEKDFDAQFVAWEQQFIKWKDENKNHPDKNQYREYEAKWTNWREQLLSRRETMRKKREDAMASFSSPGQPPAAGPQGGATPSGQQSKQPDPTSQRPWQQQHQQEKPAGADSKPNFNESGPKLTVRNFGSADNKWDKPAEKPQIKSIEETLKALFPQQRPPPSGPPRVDDPMLITLGDEDHSAKKSSGAGIPGLDLVTAETAAETLPENVPPPPGPEAPHKPITTPDTDKPFLEPQVAAAVAANKAAEQSKKKDEEEIKKMPWQTDNFYDDVPVGEDFSVPPDFCRPPPGFTVPPPSFDVPPPGMEPPEDSWSQRGPPPGQGMQEGGWQRDWQGAGRGLGNQNQRGGFGSKADNRGGRGFASSGGRGSNFGDDNFGFQQRDNFGGADYPGDDMGYGMEESQENKRYDPGYDPHGKNYNTGSSRSDFGNQGPQFRGQDSARGGKDRGRGGRGRGNERGAGGNARDFGPQGGQDFGRGRGGGRNFGRGGGRDDFGGPTARGGSFGAGSQGQQDYYDEYAEDYQDPYAADPSYQAESEYQSYEQQQDYSQDFNKRGRGRGAKQERGRGRGRGGRGGAQREEPAPAARGGRDFRGRGGRGGGYDDYGTQEDYGQDYGEQSEYSQGEQGFPDRGPPPGRGAPRKEEFPETGRGSAGRGRGGRGAANTRRGRGGKQGWEQPQQSWPRDKQADQDRFADDKGPGERFGGPAAELPSRGAPEEDIPERDVPERPPPERKLPERRPPRREMPERERMMERGRERGGYDRPYGPPGRGGMWDDYMDMYERDYYGAPPPARWMPEEEFKPAKVVDYDHQPDLLPETAVLPAPIEIPAVVVAKPANSFQEPLQTFDYGHGKAATSTIRNSERVPEAPRWAAPRRFEEEEWSRDRGVDDMRRGPWMDDKGRGRPWEDDRRRFMERDRDMRDREDRERGPPGPQRPPPGPPNKPALKPPPQNRAREPLKRNASPPPSAPPPPSLEPPPESVPVEDLLCLPGRVARPPRIAVFMRGLPGAGKSFVAKLIKDKELENGGSAPRILCLDDYFMTETEKEVIDPETGRRSIQKVMAYEYEAEMEKHYRTSLNRGFKKTVDDGYFPFIILDCVNDKLEYFEELWNYAKQKGFQTYLAELEVESSTCAKRNEHNRTQQDIDELLKGWQPTPHGFLRLDLRGLLQSASINEVEMEDLSDDDFEPIEESGMDPDEEQLANAVPTSKWEMMENTGEKLDRLDGLMRRKGKEAQTMEDWLQLDEFDSGPAEPGKKKVRWADVVERREQERMRAIGFVVGQTDWSRMTDPTFGESALTQTKYI